MRHPAAFFIPSSLLYLPLRRNLRFAVTGKCCRTYPRSKTYLTGGRYAQNKVL